MIYLSPRIGDGTYENMYQARHAETDSKRGTIDINSTHFILNSDTPCDAIQIGDINEKLSASGKKELKKLGCEIHGETLNEVLFNILRYPTIAGLNPLTAGRGSGGFELCLGKRLWIEPHIERKWVNTFSQWQWVKDKYIELRNEGYLHDGAWALAAASVSDDFEGGTESPATGWTMVSGGAGGALNQIADGTGQFNPASTNQDHFMRFDTALDSDDMEVTATWSSREGTGVQRPGGGAGARKANDTAETYYYFGQRAQASNETELAKLVTASFTLLGARDSHSASSGEVYYNRCDGSTISGGVDSVEFESQTDTSISGNNYAGIYGRCGSQNSRNVYWLEWAAEDISAPAGARPQGPFNHVFNGPFGGPIA